MDIYSMDKKVLPKGPAKMPEMFSKSKLRYLDN